jgi:signal transduction histidine kinase
MSLLLRACAVLVAVAATTSTARAQPPTSPRPIKRVLTIHAGAEAYPGSARLDATITKVLQAHPTLEVDTYVEYLENEEFGETADASLRDYIRMKFRDRPLDIVIVNTTPAVQFALRHRAELFPGVPIVFVAAAPPAELLSREILGVTGIVRDPSQTETVDLALKLHPATKRVHVVAYAPAVVGYQQRVQAQLMPIAQRATVTFANEPTLAEALAVIKQLPADSVLLYVRYSPTTKGRVIFPDEMLPQFAEASPVPIYSAIETNLDKGVVGGMMRSELASAVRLGEMTLRILEGEKPENIPIEATRMSPIFDWRQLQRWGIDESLLPQGADIRFREPTVWELYSNYIIVTVVIVIAQLLLIAALLTQSVRLRGAHDTIRARETSLLSSYERTRQMAGRLIHAQEAARAEIARDLHDDICQRLAHVAIGVTGLRTAAGDIQNATTQQWFEELERDTRNTFDGIRRLSHELHPATLRLLGLVPALRSHCAEVAKRQDVEVRFTAGDDIGRLKPEVAVCLFRIAQESLRNGIEHGGATHLTVTLERAGDAVELTVSDDGGGFDVDAVRASGGGLGLVTMEERVNLVGGTMAVVSEVGAGTTVRVRAPAPVTAPDRAPTFV